MASNFTEHFQLNQWEASDQVKREDFNEDNAKIDAAIKAVDQRVDALSAGKADKTVLSALQTAVNGKGNCQILMGSYVGTGEYGISYPSTITFPKKPIMVFFGSTGSYNGVPVHTIMLRGLEYTTIGSDRISNHITWGDRSITWYSTGGSHPRNQVNESGVTYRYFALLEA